MGDIFKKSVIAQQSVLFEQSQITFYESKTIIWMTGNVTANVSYASGSVIICDLLPWRRALDGHYLGSKVNENVRWSKRLSLDLIIWKHYLVYFLP